MRHPAVVGAQVQHHTRRAARAARPWVEGAGRAGYVAHGLVYGLVGLLALQAALGVGGDTTDKRGVLEWIVEAPFGRLALALVALGLVGYALWRLIQAVADTEEHGTDPKGLLTRGSYVISAALHAGLAAFAVKLLLGSAPQSGEDQVAQDRTAWLLSLPLGVALVTLVGVAVLGAGIVQLWKAWRGDFRDGLKLAEMSATEECWAVRAGRVGFAARGLVLGVTGGFLLLAALEAEPGQAKGLAGVLLTLAEQPAGPWLLAFVGVGLMAYGVFELVEARYRHMSA